jgi:hypothetical protein
MRTTAEQRRAAEMLAQLAGRRLRVVVDAEGWPIIPGRLGQIEQEHVLTVYTDRPRLFARLLAIPGVRSYQRGDTELRALVEPAALQAVARVIRARTKRQAGADPERMRALRARQTLAQVHETAPESTSAPGAVSAGGSSR